MKAIPMALLLLLLSFPALAVWQTLETPHFYIHFDESYDQVAARAAVIAEEAHGLLVGQFSHYPQGKIHFVLMDEGDVVQGWASPTGRNQIQISPTFPVEPLFSAGFSYGLDEWLRMVIIHELAHIFHFDIAGPMPNLVRKLFGDFDPTFTHPNMTQGPALFEGVAIYSETFNTPGGRGESAYYEMYMRAIALEGEVLRFDQFAGRYPRYEWIPTGTFYLYGYWFVEFLNQTYGPEAVYQLHHIHGNRGVLPLVLMLGPTPSLHALTGEPFSVISRKFHLWIQDRFQHQADELRRQGLTHPTPLPSLGWVASIPAIHPSGDQIAYFVTSGAAPGIYLMDLASGESRLLWYSPYLGETGLAFSPDGSQLIFSMLSPGPSQSISDIYALDITTKRLTPLTQKARAWAPAMSPTGDLLAYASRGSGNRVVESDLMISGPNGQEPRLLWEGSQERQILSLAFSPDGNQLVASVWQLGGQVDLYLIDLESGAPQQLTQGPGNKTQPTWTPDGRYIVYVSDQSGVHNLYALSPEGQIWQMTNLLYGGFAPAIAPDGEWLTFMSYGVEGYTLATLPFLPGDWTRVETKPAPSPTFNRDLPSLSELALREGHILKPYNPLSHLTPLRRLPLVAEDDGLVLGVSLAGWDPRYTISYNLSAGWGIASQYPYLSSGVQFQTQQGLGVGFYYNQNSRSVAGTLVIGQSLPLPQGWWNWSMGTGIGIHGRHLSYHPSARVGYGQYWGSDQDQFTLSSSVGAYTELPRPQENLGLGLSLEGEWRRGQTQNHTLSLQTGWSLSSNAFRRWGTRALFMDDQSQAGTSLGLYSEMNLWGIRKGLSVFPLYFDTVKGTVYLEGMMEVGTGIGLQGAIGAELALPIHPMYSASSISPTIGMAVTTRGFRFYTDFRTNY